MSDPMSAPDELRQLADRLDGHADEINETARLHGNRVPTSAMDLRAAAVALRHHANLVAENAQLRELCGFLVDACATHRIDVPIHSSLLDLAADIAGGAAAVSPPPAPTTCPECGSDNPEYDGDRWIFTGRMGEFCPDPWHEAAT